MATITLNIDDSLLHRYSNKMRLEGKALSNIISLMMTGRISSPTLQAWLFIRFSCKVPNSPEEIFLVHNEPKPVVMP